MFGIVLFWVHYIVAIVLLYTILRCSYKYTIVKKEYQKSNEKVKFPLWIIMLFIIVLFIPILNLIVYVSYMIRATSKSLFDENKDRVYYKSFLTKEY